MLTNCPRCKIAQESRHTTYAATGFCVLCGVAGRQVERRMVAESIAAAYRVGGLEAVWDLRIGDDMRARLTRMIREVNCLDPPPQNTSLTKAELLDDYLHRAAEAGARVLQRRA